MEMVPLKGRPKLGQHVALRRRRKHAQPPGQEYYWETGHVEIVRQGEVVYRSWAGYELTVPFRDLFEVPRHWGRR